MAGVPVGPAQPLPNFEKSAGFGLSYTQVSSRAVPELSSPPKPIVCPSANK